MREVLLGHERGAVGTCEGCCWGMRGVLLGHARGAVGTCEGCCWDSAPSHTRALAHTHTSMSKKFSEQSYVRCGTRACHRHALGPTPVAAAKPAHAKPHTHANPLSCPTTSLQCTCTPSAHPRHSFYLICLMAWIVLCVKPTAYQIHTRVR